MPCTVLHSIDTHSRAHLCSQVASAFSQMLNLHNLSEEISNAQIEKASRIGEVRIPPTGHVPWHATALPQDVDTHAEQARH